MCKRGESAHQSGKPEAGGERPSGTNGCVSLPSISGAFCGNPGGLANGVAGPRAASSRGVERSSVPASRPHWPPVGCVDARRSSPCFFSEFSQVLLRFESSLRGLGSVWESGALGRRGVGLIMMTVRCFCVPGCLFFFVALHCIVSVACQE